MANNATARSALECGGTPVVPTLPCMYVPTVTLRPPTLDVDANRYLTIARHETARPIRAVDRGHTLLSMYARHPTIFT